MTGARVKTFEPLHQLAKMPRSMLQLARLLKAGLKAIIERSSSILKISRKRFSRTYSSTSYMYVLDDEAKSEALERPSKGPTDEVPSLFREWNKDCDIAKHSNKVLHQCTWLVC